MMEWNNWDAPENDDLVYVRAEDQRGQYEVPFPVVFRDERWWNVECSHWRKNSTSMSRQGRPSE